MPVIASSETRRELNAAGFVCLAELFYGECGNRDWDKVFFLTV
jgi:hypothetical protein